MIERRVRRLPVPPPIESEFTMQITRFLRTHYRHFNAATLVDAADAYAAHLDGGGQMLITLAGAMSTAELGISLAEMIRQDKVHAICCTGANLEEDVFNLVAHDRLRAAFPSGGTLTPGAGEGPGAPAASIASPTPASRRTSAFRAIEQPDHRAVEGGGRAPASDCFRTSIIYRLLRDRSLIAGRPTRSTPRARGSWPRRSGTCRSSFPAGRTRPSATCSSLAC